MKLRIALLAAALGAAGLAQAAYNDVVIVEHPYYRAEPIIIYQTPGLVSGSPLHSGGATVADAQLADQVAAALASDRRLSQPSMTATVSATNGRVSLSGSADGAQAARAEQIARRVAGAGSVTAMIGTEGG
jgi:BON domain-containing protein